MIAEAIQATESIAVIDPTKVQRWDDFVDSQPGAQVFHTSEWSRVLMDAYGYKPLYAVIEEFDGHFGSSIVAGWPAMLVESKLTGRRIVSLPFTDHCQPLVRDRDDACALLNALVEHADGMQVKRLELRGWPDGDALDSRLVRVDGYVRHTMALQGGPDAIMERAWHGVRRAVRKAEKNNVSFTVGSTVKDMDAFYRLNLVLRRRHGMLPQPKRFFDAIYRHLVAVDDPKARIMFAHAPGVDEPVAGILCLRHGETATDKFAVSDQKYWDLRANHYLLWQTVCLEHSLGGKWFDLGRTDVGSKGLLQFKEQWGSDVFPAPYLYWPETGGLGTGDPTGWRRSAMRSFSRWAPTPVFELSGNLAYRHLG
jgi:hypothetical protein